MNFYAQCVTVFVLVAIGTFIGFYLGQVHMNRVIHKEFILHPKKITPIANKHTTGSEVHYSKGSAAAYKKWVREYNNAVRNGGSVGRFNDTSRPPLSKTTGSATPPPAARRPRPTTPNPGVPERDRP